MNRNKNRDSVLEKNFKHVLQTDEMLADRIQIDDKLLSRKRKKINFELDEDDEGDCKPRNINNIFETNWR